VKTVRTMIAVAAGFLLAVAMVAPASASSGDEQPVDVDPQVARMLEEVPGGVLVDAKHAVWPELHMELIVPSSASSLARAAVGSCATGLICLYDGYSLSGTKLTFGTCGISTVPSSFATRSLANARSSGYTQARNGTTVLATASAGGWTNVYGTTTNIRCVF